MLRPAERGTSRTQNNRRDISEPKGGKKSRRIGEGHHPIRIRSMGSTRVAVKDVFITEGSIGRLRWKNKSSKQEDKEVEARVAGVVRYKKPRRAPKREGQNGI